MEPYKDVGVEAGLKGLDYQYNNQTGRVRARPHSCSERRAVDEYMPSFEW